MAEKIKTFLDFNVFPGVQLPESGESGYPLTESGLAVIIGSQLAKRWLVGYESGVSTREIRWNVANLMNLLTTQIGVQVDSALVEKSATKQDTLVGESGTVLMFTGSPNQPGNYTPTFVQPLLMPSVGASTPIIPVPNSGQVLVASGPDSAAANGLTWEDRQTVLGNNSLSGQLVVWGSQGSQPGSLLLQEIILGSSRTGGIAAYPVGSAYSTFNSLITNPALPIGGGGLGWSGSTWVQVGITAVGTSQMTVFQRTA